MDMLKRDMEDYYARRASEYEGIYQKPERQEDLKKIQAFLSQCFKGLDLLEIACGTGYWTQFACRSANSILATDYNMEVLDIAKKKDYGTCPVIFARTDAYGLDEVKGLFSAALVGFWWSHVPKAKIDVFLKVMHSKLLQDALVIFLDNQYVKGSSTPISRTDNDGNTYQIRRLTDGSIHEVLKNFPTREEFSKRIKPFSKDFSLTTLDYFWMAQYNLNKKVV